MKSYRQIRVNSWLLLITLAVVAFMSAGCSSSTTSSSNVNPLGAYQTTTPVTDGPVTDGSIQNPGAIDSPIISTPADGSGSIDGHSNAPLLDNMHPGWQQADCLSCHSEASRNPDHYYTDSSMCYLCHGTNGLPGFGDNIPPIISGVVANPTSKTVMITWKSDELCLSRLVLRTRTGDRLEFPVSTSYSTSHKFEMSGLQAVTQYTYEVICTDKSGNKTTSASFGTLSFTTTDAEIDVDSVDGGNAGTVDSYFTNVKIESDGAFKATIKCTVAEPSTVLAYFIYAETNQLDSQINLNNLAGGGPKTNFDVSIMGLDAGTDYKVYLEAYDSNNKSHESKIYNITTDSFGG